MIPAPTDTDGPVELDREVCKSFWEQRAQLAGDPRSVTLDRHPAWSVRIQVALYQGWLFRRLPKRRLTRIVDLACGNGDWTTEFATRAERVTAVDFSEGMVAACRARLERAGQLEQVDLLCGDVSEVAMPPSDLVVAGAVTQYLDDERVDALLANARAALGTDGLFYLRTTVTNSASTQVRSDATFQGVYRPKPWFDERIARAGFEILETTTATEFVADEAARKLFGPLRPLLYYPLLGIRKLTRRRDPTNVAVYLARPTR